MQITLVVKMCHALASINAPVCHEVVVIKDDMSMQVCMMAEAALADWKSKTIYADDKWTIEGFKCAPGEYVVKDAI